MNVDSIMLNALMSEEDLQRRGHLQLHQSCGSSCDSAEMDPSNLLDMRLQARLFFIVFY